MADEQIYYIEKILDRRNVNGRLEYKIKWDGYPLNQSTWEPLENLKTAIELVEEYDRTHPAIKFSNKKRNRGPKPNNKKPENNEVKKENSDQEIKEEEQVKEEKGKEIDDKEKQSDIILQQDNIRNYNIDDNLKKVTTVRKRDNKLMAVVVKMKEDGETEEIEIETNKLKKDNPWILLDFYESKIKFT